MPQPRIPDNENLIFFLFLENVTFQNFMLVYMLRVMSGIVTNLSGFFFCVCVCIKATGDRTDRRNLRRSSYGGGVLAYIHIKTLERIKYGICKQDPHSSKKY